MATGRRIAWGWIVSGLLIVVVAVIPVVRGFIGRTALFVIRPVAKFGQGMTDHWPSFGNAAAVTKDRDKLQQQVGDLTTRLYEANLQLETVQAAVKLSDFSSSIKHRILNATVIATSPDPGVLSVTIDHGSDDGIQIGQLAVADRGSAIGKVVTVHQTVSTILLITDRQSVISGRVQNQAQSPGVISGERGLSLQMGFIPKNDELKNGDTVVTSGTENLIPPDILIGSLGSFSSHPGDLFQQAVVTPTANLNRLRIVGIIFP